MTAVECSSVPSISQYCLTSRSLPDLKDNLPLYNEAIIGRRRQDYSTSQWLSQLLSNSSVPESVLEPGSAAEQDSSVVELLLEVILANGVYCDRSSLPHAICVPVYHK